MKPIKKTSRTEFEIFIAILAVALLNGVVFVSVSAGELSKKISIAESIDTQLILYSIYIVLSVICILLKKGRWLKLCFYALMAFLTARILLNLYSLIINPLLSDNGRIILVDAMLIWSVSIIVFSMWYWVIDRGGPVARFEESDETRFDLLFPQYQSPIKGWEHWHPKFLDYVFFSFFTSTGFSPADTLPLTKRVKFLMMIEAFISLVIIGMVAARAISLIQN